MYFLIKQTWWGWHSSLRYETDQNKAKDRLREIKQYEWDRDRTIANAAVKGKIWNSLGSKKALQNQIKVIIYINMYSLFNLFSRY